MALNKIIVMGRLTATPELKKTQNGTNFTNFSIAVDRKHTPKGEEKKADFLPCEAWRQTAEFICNYFGKGDTIAIVGELHADPYTDKKSGERRTAFKIIVDESSFCGGKNDKSNSNNNTPAIGTDEGEYYGIGNDDDLPF